MRDSQKPSLAPEEDATQSEAKQESVAESTDVESEKNPGAPTKSSPKQSLVCKGQSNMDVVPPPHDSKSKRPSHKWHNRIKAYVTAVMSDPAPNTPEELDDAEVSECVSYCVNA